MSLEEIKESVRGLNEKDRKELSAFLTVLRHERDPEYRMELARKIDDKDPENWLSLEEFDRRLGFDAQ